MPRKKQPKKEYGEGECQYRFCNRPDKKFTKKKEDQNYCCTSHRIKEWNLKNPRIKEDDSKKQEPLDFEMKEKEVFSQPMFDPETQRIHKSEPIFFTEQKPKRTFHLSSINKDNKRGRILRDTLELLMRTEPTTREINLHSGSTRASSDISELRHQGFDIECIPSGESSNGIKINRFRLSAEGKERAIKFFQENKL